MNVDLRRTNVASACLGSIMWLFDILSRLAREGFSKRREAL